MSAWWEDAEHDGPESFAELSGVSSTDTAAELKALREEVAALRAAVGTGAEDAATVSVIAENRRQAQVKAEQAARAAAAANDPNMVEQLRAINDPAELDRFMRERGYSGHILH